MLLDDLRLVAPQPLATDREPAEAFALGDAGFLQQRQAAATCADENELRRVGKLAAGLQVLHLHIPAGLGAREVGHAMFGGVAAAILFAEPLHEQVGQCAEIHVSAAIHFGGGNGRVVSTS